MHALERAIEIRGDITARIVHGLLNFGKVRRRKKKRVLGFITNKFETGIIPWREEIKAEFTDTGEHVQLIAKEEINSQEGIQLTKRTWFFNAISVTSVGLWV